MFRSGREADMIETHIAHQVAPMEQAAAVTNEQAVAVVEEQAAAAHVSKQPR